MDEIKLVNKLLKNNLMFLAIKLTTFFISLVVIFFVIGLMTTANPSSRITTTFFSNWTSNLNQSVFSILYSMENRPYAILSDDDTTGLAYSHYSFSSLLNFQLADFKSLIGKELPGFSTYEQTVIIASEQLGDLAGMFHESGPPIEDILEDRQAIDETDDETKQEQADISEKVVFLYSSHNRESFLPHLPNETEPDRAYHKEVNITKVSERLANQLEKKKIGTSFDNTDITTILHEKGWTYGKSYEASRPVVQGALKEHDEIKYVFDIHRDSLPYDKTTLETEETSYATFLFVIGAENKHYEKNLKLATELHYLLQEKLPGISRGVITKEGPNSNGVYNQDLVDNALLIEVGGYDNELNEMYRSIDLLADVFSSYFWKAERVSK